MHPGLHDQFGAGWSLAPMRAGLQSDIHDRVPSFVSRLLQRHLLSVRAAELLVPAPSNNLAAFDDDAANLRVRSDSAASLLGKPGSYLHVLLVRNHLAASSRRPLYKISHSSWSD